MIFIDKLSDFTAKYPERIFIKSKDYKLTYEELSEDKKTLKLLAKKALPVRHSIEKLPFKIKESKIEHFNIEIGVKK